MPSSSSRSRHFSMIRGFKLADFFTLGNAGCGVAAVFFAMLYMEGRPVTHFYSSAGMIAAAFVFDVLDGRVARWRHEHSPLGRELDSLADILSFGMAPAVLGFAGGLRGGWDWIALIYFVCCGVSRLARYNITAETLSAGAEKVDALRGHAHPHQRCPRRCADIRCLERADWGTSLLGRLDDGTVGAASIGALFVLSGTLMISKTLLIPKI